MTTHLARELTTNMTTTMTARQLTGLPRTLTEIGLIGAGLAAGVFFAFSTFVMTGLRSAPASAGLASMQGINRAAPNPLFMLVLFGTAAITVGLGIRGLRHLDQPWALWQIAAAICYLIAIGLTAAYHVPANNALAKLDPNAASSVSEWLHYVKIWTALNHLRTLGCGLSSVCLVVSLRVR